MSERIPAYTTVMDAYIVKGRLESEGIPATIVDSYYIGLDWTMSFALGGVKIHIPDAYKDQAMTVLDDIEAGGYYLTGDLAKEEPIHCTKCHATNVFPSDFSWKFSFVFLFLLATPYAVPVPVPYTRRYFHCMHCSHVFAVKKDYSILIPPLASLLFVGVFLSIFYLLASLYYFKQAY